MQKTTDRWQKKLADAKNEEWWEAGREAGRKEAETMIGCTLRGELIQREGYGNDQGERLTKQELVEKDALKNYLFGGEENFEEEQPLLPPSLKMPGGRLKRK